MSEGINFKVTALTSGALRMLTSKTLQSFFFTASLLTLNGPPLPTICKEKSSTVISRRDYFLSIIGCESVWLKYATQASEPQPFVFSKETFLLTISAHFNFEGMLDFTYQCRMTVLPNKIFYKTQSITFPLILHIKNDWRSNLLSNFYILFITII